MVFKFGNLRSATVFVTFKLSLLLFCCLHCICPLRLFLTITIKGFWCRRVDLFSKCEVPRNLFFVMRHIFTLLYLKQPPRQPTQVREASCNPCDFVYCKTKALFCMFWPPGGCRRDHRFSAKKKSPSRASCSHSNSS